MGGLGEQSPLMFRLGLPFILIAVITAMGYIIISLHKQNQLKDTIISQLHSSIESNNEVIKKLEIDLETYKNKEPIIKEKIVNRYIKIQAKDDKCESQMEAMGDLMKKFLEKK